MKTEEELRKLFYNYANAHIEIGYCETEPVLEVDSFIELMKELKFLNLHDVSGMSLSDYAKEKLDFINGSCIATEFPKHRPTKEWAGAVLDLLEELKLGDYR